MTHESVAFGRSLKAVMQERRVPCKELAAVTGKSMSSITQARAGRFMPSIAYAVVLSEALHAPELLALCAKLRTRTCELCEREYVSMHRGGYPQRWCSVQCRDTGRARESGEFDKAWRLLRYDRWKRLAVKRQGAVDAMCWDCEPEGACRTSGCPLRPVSPLPLIGAIRVPQAARGTVRLAADDPRRAIRRRARQAVYSREARRRRASA